MAEEHAFAHFLRIVGRGPRLSRSLERSEAREAMAAILAGAVEPAQIGAFLVVLRYRGETPAELAGFVEAARAHVARGAEDMLVDLDWPSYADRHRQQPWFVLAALLLATHGCRVLMHGIAGQDEGCAPTRPVLERLGLRPCASAAEAATALRRDGIAYLGLERCCAPLESLFALRPLLGLRTVAHTVARALNPYDAPRQLTGVFHPPYRELHRETAALLGQPHAAIFKGGGGEAQRNPLKPTRLTVLRDGRAGEEDWPALLPETAYQWRAEDLDPEAAAALWRGEREDPIPVAAVTGTAAIALALTGAASGPEAAQSMAEKMWAERPRARFGGAGTVAPVLTEARIP